LFLSCYCEEKMTCPNSGFRTYPDHLKKNISIKI
jgi:hypothetical protein